MKQHTHRSLVAALFAFGIAGCGSSGNGIDSTSLAQDDPASLDAGAPTAEDAGAPTAEDAGSKPTAAPTAEDAGSKPTPAPTSDAGAKTPPPSPDRATDAGTAPPPADAGSASSSSSSGTSGTYLDVELTFYGYPDNSPPGPGIALPVVHSQAGGTGTWADPITFASATAEFPAGTRLYVPFLKRYVIMEDICAQCTTDWSSGKRHIDVWMNSTSQNASQLLSCQEAWTRPSVQVEVSPPADRPVDSANLFTPSTGACLTPGA